MAGLCFTDISSHAEETDSESSCTNISLQRSPGKCSKGAWSVKEWQLARGTDCDQVPGTPGKV